MKVWVRDINWDWHLFENAIELNRYYTEHKNKYDFVFSKACGLHLSHIELIMVKREQ